MLCRLDVVGGRCRQHQDTIVGYPSSEQRCKRARVGNVLDYLRRVNDIEAAPFQRSTMLQQLIMNRHAEHAGANLAVIGELDTNRVAANHLPPEINRETEAASYIQQRASALRPFR